MKWDILIVALVIGGACSRKIGREPLPPATSTDADIPLSRPEPDRQSEPTHRCLKPSDPGYDINNGAPECVPDRTTNSAPAATSQPAPVAPP